MKSYTKKAISSLLTATTIMAMTAGPVFAHSSGSEKGGWNNTQAKLEHKQREQGNKQNNQGGRQENDGRMQSSFQFLNMQWKDDLKHKDIHHKGFEKDGPHKYGNLKTDAIEKAIAALSDEAVKAELFTLLNNYKDIRTSLKAALEGATDKTQWQSIIDSYEGQLKVAKTALFNALVAVGIATQPSGEEKKDKEIAAQLPAEGQINKEPGKPAEQLKTDAIEKAIGALSDEAVKAELLTLLNTYKNIQESLTTALEGVAGEVERQSIKDSYKEQLETAKTALFSALNTAGIATPQGKCWIEKSDEWLKANFIVKAIQGLSDQTLKEGLLALVDNYRALQESLKSALEGVTDQTERQTIIDSYGEEIKAAKTALTEAVTRAGLSLISPSINRFLNHINQ